MPVDFSLTDVDETPVIRRADGFRLRATLRAATVVDGDRFDHWTIVGDVVEDLPDCNRDTVERGRLRLLRGARDKLAWLRAEHMRSHD